MIQPYLTIVETSKRGRGVFTSENIPADTILEISPVIVMCAAEKVLLDQTKLHDYIFEWDNEKKECCMAMGYVPVYNHAHLSNCEYEMDFESETIMIRSMRDIKAGEELFINYNGDWDDPRPVWFEQID